MILGLQGVLPMAFWQQLRPSRRHAVRNSCLLSCGVFLVVLHWLLSMQSHFIIEKNTHTTHLIPPQMVQTRKVHSSSMEDPAIIVFCHNRPNYLNATLQSLANLEELENFSVYVSQDGENATMSTLIESVQALFMPPRTRKFQYWQKKRDPGRKQSSPAWISQHYKWGLTRVFEHHSHAIIVEEDMLLSPDFLTYFEATAWLLDKDPTLWCISSWNDNCYADQHNWDARRMFRNSYFPGLGWMLKRETWLELKPHWIEWGNWDVGIRILPEKVARNRDCICPELSRNRNIGAVGANMHATWFNSSFSGLTWSTSKSETFGNLSYLIEENYLRLITDAFKIAKPWAIGDPDPVPGNTYLLTFTKETWPSTATYLNIWGVGSIRGMFRYVAVVPWRGARFLVADRNLCPFVNISIGLGL